MRRKWQKFQQLSWAEIFLLAQALLLLPIIGLGLRLVGLRRWQYLLEQLSPIGQIRSLSAAEISEAQALARLVSIAAAHGVYHAVCLPRSVALWWWLRRRGIASVLRLGVRKDKHSFEAHAWVECQGVIINDTSDVNTQFTPFAQGFGTAR